VHPQLWPQDLDWTGKRVVVIGGGATAVTLVPATAKDAAHVTMLQRSPSWTLAMPGEDAFARVLGHVLPPRLRHARGAQRALDRYDRRAGRVRARHAALGARRVGDRTAGDPGRRAAIADPAHREALERAAVALLSPGRAPAAGR
jgi:cation diffusion facilitator CzcD-associated flavoprotein CzcO